MSLPFLTVLALIVLLPLIFGCAGKEPVRAEAARTAEPVVAWPKTPCRASVEALLARGGLSLAQMETLTVREERLNGGQPGEQVGHWYLTGRPATCSSGHVAMTILPNCAISSWRTNGGCRVAGIEAGR
jgi:hypothetical protein